MEIIPAIDIINGQCIRLTAGDFARQTTYADDPLTVAQRFEQHGARRLHVVDLDGARARQPVNLAVLERLARHTHLHIDFGGGIQSDAAAHAAFNAGAAQLTAGSLAVREPATVKAWLQRFGPERIIIGADFRGPQVAINAWAEAASLTLVDLIADYLQAGATTFICTDVSKDGMMQGPALAEYQQLLARFPQMQLIASGGVTTAADVLTLRGAGLYGSIIGKAFYEGTIALTDIPALLPVVPLS